MINTMQNTVRYMRVGKGADCAAVAMLVNEALGLVLLASPFSLQSAVADLFLTLAFSPPFTRNCFVAFAARRNVLIFLCEIQPHF